MAEGANQRAKTARRRVAVALGSRGLSARHSSQGAMVISQASRPTPAIATNLNRSGQRAASVSSLWMSWNVLKPISGSSRKKARRAVSPASLRAPMKSMPFRTPKKSKRATAPGMSDFLDVGPAEQALGQEDQRYGDHREGGDVLVVDREVGRP